MSSNLQYSLFDIDKTNVRALDKYIKTLIVNAKIRYDKKQAGIYCNELFVDDFEKVFLTQTIDEYTQDTYPAFAGASIYEVELLNDLNFLSELERDIIIYNIFNGYNIKEIAKKKGLTDRTIRKYKKSALEKIKSYL